MYFEAAHANPADRSKIPHPAVFPVTLAVALMLTFLVGCASSTTMDSGPPGDAAMNDAPVVTGCADGGTCPAGQMCCQGVPYPAEGTCAATCGMLSDRNAKEHFAPVDQDRALGALVSLPISEWNYRGEPGVRHVGPMAQDFRTAFGLGRDERVIHPIDAQGVTMAAVQALHRRVVQLEGQLATLRGAQAARGRCPTDIPDEGSECNVPRSRRCSWPGIGGRRFGCRCVPQDGRSVWECQGSARN